MAESNYHTNRDALHQESCTPSQDLSFFPDYALSQRKKIGAFVALLLVFAFHRLPLLELFSVAYFGGARGDAGLYVWLSRIVPEALSPARWYDTPAFVPYSGSLAWSDNYILPSLIVSLFETLGFSHVVSYNLSLLLSQLIGGYLFFRLAFLLSGQYVGCLFAAAVFLTVGYHSAVVGHPQLHWWLFLPLSFLCFFRFIRFPSVREAALLGLTLVGAFLSSVYFALYSGLAALVSYLFFSQLRQWRISFSSHRQFFLGVFGCGLILLPFALPYFQVAGVFSSRELFEAFAFRAEPYSYFAAPEHSVLYRSLSTLSHGEARLFPGLVIYCIALFGLAPLWSVHPLRRLLGLGLVCLLLASILVAVLPERGDTLLFTLSAAATTLLCWSVLVCAVLSLRVLGKREAQAGAFFLTNRAIIALLISLSVFFYLFSFGPIFDPRSTVLGSLTPFGVIFHFAPGFDSMRAVSRSGIMVLFFLSLLLPFGIRGLVSFGRVGIAGVAFLFVLAYLENSVRVFDLEPEQKFPDILSDVKRLAEPGDVVMFLPWTEEIYSQGGDNGWDDFARKNSIYMNWGASSNLPIVNGYSGVRTKLMKELPRKMSGFPDRRSINTLSYIGNLRFVVVVPYLLERFDEDAFEKKLSAFENDLSLIGRDGDGNYAFEFIGESRVREGFHTLVSTGRGNALHFEVKGLYKPNSPETVMTIREMFHHGGDALGTLRFASDGRWHGFLIPLPDAQKSVIPFQLSFESEEGDLFVRRIRSVYRDVK